MMDVKGRVDWREETERQIALEDYKLESEEGLERLKYQVEYSQAALKNLQLVNGGGIIALLTFIGNVENALDMRSAHWSLIWFSLGLGSSLVAYLGAYLSQSEFMNVAFSKAWEAQHRAKGSKTKFPHEDHIVRGNLALRAAITLAVFSMAFFVVGSFVAIEGLR